MESGLFVNKLIFNDSSGTYNKSSHLHCVKNSAVKKCQPRECLECMFGRVENRDRELYFLSLNSRHKHETRLDMRQKEIELAWAKPETKVIIHQESDDRRLTRCMRRMKGRESVRESYHHFYLFIFYL